MAFSRSSEPFQEPPQHQPRSPLVIGVVVLFLFFVPLVVVTAADSGRSSAAAQSRSRAAPDSAPAPGQVPAGPVSVPAGPPPGGPPPQGSLPGGPASAGPPRPGAPHRVPPMPPPGAPWPPPPGAPVPPVCALEYRAGADGGTVWTALTTSPGTLTVQAGPLRDSLHVGVAVAQVRLPTALAGDHGLVAVLTADGGRTFDCVVGAQREA
jgi:hypothetical protein